MLLECTWYVSQMDGEIYRWNIFSDSSNAAIHVWYVATQNNNNYNKFNSMDVSKKSGWQYENNTRLKAR